MFSSNQEFSVSGSMSQLASALEFAINYDETSPQNLVYQTTEDGKFCIGWASDGKPENGWNKFQFDFDYEIVSRIIVQFLNKQKTEGSPYDYFDGGTDKGFLMKSIPDLFSDEYNGIKHPFYGIVSFEPFINFYAK